MKIRIRSDAAELYIQENSDQFGGYFGDFEWEETLSKIAGKTVEVDTEDLFKHEFNTKPIPNISEEGIRIFEEYVVEVIDDEREGKARCDLCNRTSQSDEKCTNCGRSDYLDPFMDKYMWI